MLTTSQFAFVHLERTGGNFARVFFERFFDVQHIGYHYPRILLPTHARHLPLLGFVRNPWDWYVSFFHIGKEKPQRNPVNWMASGCGKDDFRTTVGRLARLGSADRTSSDLRNRIIELLPDSIEGNADMGITKTCLAGFRDEETGLYSWLLRRMFANEDGNLDGVAFGRFESLRQDLAQLLERSGVPLNSEMWQYLSETPPHGASKHHEYAAYYDDELRDLVARQERFVIETFGYTF